MRTLRVCAAAAIFLSLIILKLALAGQVPEHRSDNTEARSTAVKQGKIVSLSAQPTTASASGDTSQTNVPSPDLLFPETTSLAALKYLPDDTQVCVNGKVVVWVCDFSFYVEEADGSAAIRTEMPSPYPATGPVGSIVNFSGTLKTGFSSEPLKTSYERYILIDPDTLVIQNPDTPAPTIPRRGIKHKFIAGHPLSKYTPGLEKSIYTFNVGVSVKVWGKVLTCNQNDPYDVVPFFYIDDGAKLKDGSIYEGVPNTGLRIRYSDYHPSPGDWVVVNGVAGTDLWDPTPDAPSSGDEFVIPVVRTSTPDDVKVIADGFPPSGGTGPDTRSVTGHVRALGQASPGVKVRVYSPYSSKIISGVTDTGADYTLGRIATTGGVIMASAPGYKSCSVVANPGQPVPDLILEPFQQADIDVSTDKLTIKACGNEMATVRAFLRDCEGKGLRNRLLRITTNKGSFTENGTKEYEYYTNNSGTITAHLQANPDGPSTALVSVCDKQNENISAQTTVVFIGYTMHASASPDYLIGPGDQTSQVKAVAYDENMQPLANVPVLFKTDQGGFQESTGNPTYTGVTNDQGEAYATLKLSQPSTATITVRTSDPCGNETVAWVVVSYRGTAWQDIRNGVGFSSPLVADLDQAPDGKKEIAIAGGDGKLHVWKSDGTLLWESVAEFGNNANNTPSVANLNCNPDGRQVVLIPSEAQTRLCAYDAKTGVPLAGWPTITNYTFKHVAPAIADVNLDGAPEVMVGDESCFVFSWNGTGNWEGKDTAQSSFMWRNLTGSTGTVIYGSTVAVGDMDNDQFGIPDVVVGTNSAEVYVFPGNAWGDFTCTPSLCVSGALPPLYTPGWPKPAPSNAQSSPAICDLDHDGKNDFTILCDRDYLMIYLSSDNSWRSYHLSDNANNTPEQSDPECSPTLVDLDGDGYVDIIVGTDEGKVFAFDGKSLAQKHILLALDGWEGGIVPNPSINPNNISGYYDIRSSAAVGDVNDDGQLEVVIGSSDGNLYAIYAKGTRHVGSDGHRTGPLVWARCCRVGSNTTAKVKSSPAIDDVDLDGKVDVVVGSENGLFLFPFDAAYHADRMPWPTFHHDNARIGSLAQPAPLKYGSIVGRVTRSGVSVCGYDVKIEYSDGTPVYQPPVDPYHPEQGPLAVRPRVRTVGDPLQPDTAEANRGGYSINQLDSNRTYKISVGPKGFSTPDKVIPAVVVPASGGTVRLDIDLGQ